MHGETKFDTNIDIYTTIILDIVCIIIAMLILLLLWCCLMWWDDAGRLFWGDTVNGKVLEALMQIVFSKKTKIQELRTESSHGKGCLTQNIYLLC